MAGQRFTEPVGIRVDITNTDGAGGLTSTVSTLLDTVNCTIEQSPSKFGKGEGRQNLSGSYKIELWNNPNYVITPTHYLEWRNKRLNIQSILYSDNFNKITITASD